MPCGVCPKIRDVVRYAWQRLLGHRSLHPDAVAAASPKLAQQTPTLKLSPKLVDDDNVHKPPQVTRGRAPRRKSILKLSGRKKIF